jgi:hypothetical protein
MLRTHCLHRLFCGLSTPHSTAETYRPIDPVIKCWYEFRLLLRRKKKTIIFLNINKLIFVIHMQSVYLKVESAFLK